jgi:Flp pilus assembly pilin Flp
MLPAAQLRRLRLDTRGLAAVEFALVLPVLVALLFGTVEVGRYIYLHLKVQNAASNVADILSRPEQVAASDISALFSATPVMLRPFDAGARTRMIVSGVIVPDEDEPAEVAWQSEGGGSLGVTSAIGAVGEIANVPGGLVYHGGEAVIAAEVFYAYEPWLLHFVPSRQIRADAYFRPRRGTLAAIN